MLVEGCGFELVFGGSEQQLQFLRLVEAVGDEPNLLLRQLRYQIALSKASFIFSFANIFSHLLNFSKFLPQTISVPINHFLIRFHLPHHCFLQISAHFVCLFARQSVVPFLPVYLFHQLSTRAHAGTAEVLFRKLLSGFSDVFDELFLESQDFGKDLSAAFRPIVDHFRDFFDGTVAYAPDVNVLSAGLAACIRTSESICAFLVEAYFGDFLSLGTRDVRVLLSEAVQQRLQLFVGVLASFDLHFANTYFSIINLSNITRTYTLR